MCENFVEICGFRITCGVYKIIFIFYRFYKEIKQTMLYDFLNIKCIYVDAKWGCVNELVG